MGDSIIGAREREWKHVDGLSDFLRRWLGDCSVMYFVCIVSVFLLYVGLRVACGFAETCVCSWFNSAMLFGFEDNHFFGGSFTFEQDISSDAYTIFFDFLSSDSALVASTLNCYLV